MKRFLAVFMILLLCGCQTAQYDAKCTVSVTCEQVLERMELLGEEKAELIPEDGVLFSDTVAFASGENLLDVLTRALKQAGVVAVSETTPGNGGGYISSIGGLAPADCGPMSGWTFTVNGEYQSTSCDRIILQDGDVVEWIYVCEWTE